MKTPKMMFCLVVVITFATSVPVHARSESLKESPKVMGSNTELPTMLLPPPKPIGEQTGSGDKPTDNKKPADEVKKPKDPLEALRSLYVEIPDVSMKDVPFEEFTLWLSRQTQVNVVVPWKYFEKLGMGKDRLITVDLKKPLVRDVLRAVLDQIQTDDHPLGYRTIDNFIRIATVSQLNSAMVVKTYELLDLQIVVPSFGGFGDAARAHPVQNSDSANANRLDGADENTKKIVEMIVQTVFPETWKVNGGQGTISYFNGKLIIRNTPEVHKALAGNVRRVGG